MLPFFVVKIERTKDGHQTISQGLDVEQKSRKGAKAQRNRGCTQVNANRFVGEVFWDRIYKIDRIGMIDDLWRNG